MARSKMGWRDCLSGGTSKVGSSIAKATERCKPFQSGFKLGDGYIITSSISSGTQGDVYVAASRVHTSASGAATAVAVKRARITSSAISGHVQQEVTTVFHARSMHAEEVGDPGSPGHPHIVAYLDWFAGPAGIEREVCLVMERAEFSLHDLIKSASVLRGHYEKKAAEHKRSHGICGKHVLVDASLYRFTEREVMKVAKQMLSALAFLNRHGILHRDVKAENILWFRGEPEGSFKLADFGTAATLAPDEEGKASEGGTLWTMAPEILGRRLHGPNCDTWSLGVVLFEMASLDKLFNSKELMAYRNSNEAPTERNFWSTILAFVAGGTAPAVGGGKPIVTATTPAAPVRSLQKRFGKSKQLGEKEEKKKKEAGEPEKENAKEKPSRPSKVKLKSVASAPLLPDVTPSSSGSTSPVASTRRPSLSSMGSSGRLSLARMGSAGRLGLPPLQTAAAGQGQAISPRQRKHTFLRKRCASRWCYSEDLRLLIFDDMLEEVASQRPTAAELLASPNLQALSAQCEVAGPERPSSSDSVETAEEQGEAAVPFFVKLARSAKYITADVYYEACKEELELQRQAKAVVQPDRGEGQPAAPPLSLLAAA